MAAPLFCAPLAADLVKDDQAIDLDQEKYRLLFQELKASHNFSQAELDTLFAGQTINRRVLELMDKQWEAKPYYEYAPLFLTPMNIDTGRKKLIEHREILDRIERDIGVDREIVVAIWGIETRYGTNQGSFNVLRTLNTLFAAYPRRSDFFRKELVQFLLLCKENGVDPKTVNGSYAGAFGQTQFIPSSFRSYAVSFRVIRDTRLRTGTRAKRAGISLLVLSYIFIILACFFLYWPYAFEKQYRKRKVLI